MDKKEFGKRLRSIRKRKGYSQHQLAEMMGYKDHSTLAKVEIGVNDIPFETLYRYAEVLEVDVQELLGIGKSPKTIGKSKSFIVKSTGIEVVIRDIERKDYDVVASLWRDVLNVPTSDEDLRKTYEKMEGDDHYHTLVAEVGGKVVGLVTMAFVYAIGHPNGYFKINGLGVAAEHRGKGIGKALLEAVEHIALDCGAPYIGLASGFDRADAHAFYEHLGYKKTSFWFRKKLSE